MLPRLPITAFFLLSASLLWANPLASSSEATPAEKAYQLGQAALDRDRFDEAIGQFQFSLRLDPRAVQNHIGLAAAYFALGQDQQALPHLEAYLAACPDHV